MGGEMMMGFPKSFRKYLTRETLEDINFLYLPILGVVSHTSFSVHILNREFLPALFPTWHLGIANALLFNSHLGVGLYLYSRKCLKAAPYTYRLLWSVYGSAMFNFGTILICGTVRQLLIKDRLISFLYAISSSLCYMAVAKQFFDFVDSRYR